MAEETNMKEVVEEVKNATEEELKEVIKKWFESTRTQGLKMGAQYISAVIFDVIQKHIKKKNGSKASLRDYQRCVDEIINIISVQLTNQNSSEETEINEATEEVNNDGTAE